MTVEVSPACLIQSAEVLARQEQHCVAVESYLRREGGIHDDTGLLLAMFAAPAEVVLEAGCQVTMLAARIGATAADRTQRSLDAYLAADQSAYEAFARLAANVGISAPPRTDPTQGVPSVGDALGGAPEGYGEPTRWLTSDVGADLLRNATVPPPFQAVANAHTAAQGAITAVRPSLEQLADAGRGLAGEVAGWEGPAGAVAEVSDPETYLVTPDLGLDEVQELRWSAGVVLGGLDWLAEQLLGFSILEEVVFKPFGGDYQGIRRASMAWASASGAFTAVAENFAGLTSTTLEGWKGEAGERFRGAMAVCAGGFLGFSEAALHVSGLAQTVSYVSQGACIAIGMLLKKISEKLIRIAVEAAVPVAGWLAGAAEVVILIQDVISYVRLAYVVIEAIVDAIDGFIQAKTAVLQNLGVVEDLVEYMMREATS